MARVFICDVCRSEMSARDMVVFKFKKLEHICEECGVGVSLFVALARRLPLTKKLQEIYNQILIKEYNQGQIDERTGQQERDIDDPG